MLSVDVCSLSLLSLLPPSLNVCPDIFVVAQSLRPSLYVRYFTCETSPSLQSNQILSVLFVFMLVLHTPPVSGIPLIQSLRPSSIGTSGQKKQSIITPRLFAAD